MSILERNNIFKIKFLGLFHRSLLSLEGKKDNRSKSSIRVIRDESRKGRSKGVVVKERQPAVYTMAVQGG